MNERTKPRLLRNFATTGLLIAGAIIGAGCDNSPSPTPIAEVSQLYPEVSGIVPKSSGVIATAETSTQWFNFSDTPFNSDAAKKIFSYYEDLGNMGPIFRVDDATPPFDLGITIRDRKKRVLFIATEDMPNPSWSLEPEGFGATTFEPDNSDTYAIHVKMLKSDKNKDIFPTTAADASYFLDIESCQTTIKVDATGDISDDAAQELVCNSLGWALGAKQVGLTYDQYYRKAQITYMRLYGIDLPMLQFNENMYEEMPQTPAFSDK